MAVLINGNGYSPVTAQQDADLYAGIVGNSTTVLRVGNEMAAQIYNATTIRILDGEAVSQGRRIHLDPGGYDDFTIPAGTQGVTSYYIIGYHLYSDSSGNELCETFVQNVASASATIEEEQLRDGATDAYVSMYRVTMSGTTLGTPTPLFTTRTATVVQHGTSEDILHSPAGTAFGYTIYFPKPFGVVPTVTTNIHVNSTSVYYGSVSIAIVNVTTTYVYFDIHNDSGHNLDMRIDWIAVATE